MNFWQNLPKPIFGLSPMDGVTDPPMRFITAKYGKPALTMTEFTHVQGLWFGKLIVWTDMLYDEIERPVIAQIFGSEPEYFYKVAPIICELGFDGIDINMGCPADAIVKKGGGASLILDPKRAQEIIRQTKKGVTDWVNGMNLEDIDLDIEKIHYIREIQKTHPLKTTREPLPVSVKTRIGFDKIVIEEWVKNLLEVTPANISVHGRTLKQMYGGSANWEAIGSVTKLIHDSGATYLGNGDVKSLEEAQAKVDQYGVDGVLIGRAALGNPWIFRGVEPTLQEKLQVAWEHSLKQEEIKSGKRFCEIKKHLGWYCKGFDGAQKLRMDLMTTENLAQIKEKLEEFGL